MARPVGSTTGGRNKKAKERLLPLEPDAVLALEADLSDPEKRGAAARYILDQLYGKAPQAVEVTGEDGGPISVQIVQAMPAKNDSST